MKLVIQDNKNAALFLALCHSAAYPESILKMLDGEGVYLVFIHFMNQNGYYIEAAVQLDVFG